MYELMLEIHIAGVIICLYMLYLLLRRKGRQSNSFIVLAIVLNLFILLGYTFELLSTNIQEMLLAIQIGYMGKCFAGICFVTGVGKYYNWKYRAETLPLLWGIGFLSFCIIMTAKYHNIYYTSIGMVWIDGHAFCSLGKAPYYYFFFGYLIFLFLYFSVRCLAHRKNVKSSQEKSIMTVVGYGSIVAVIAVIGVLFVPIHFDFGPMIFAIYSLVFLYCILRFRMFDTVDTAIYQMAIENAQVILVTRADGQVEFANKTAERVLPWLLESERREIAEKVKREFLSGKEEYRADGRDYQIIARQVSDYGSVVGYAVTLTDITKLRQYMVDLERLSNEATEASRAKSNFLANMSHEIRTPINTMLGMNEMIVREAISEDVASYAANIREAGRTLLAIINDILDFSKIESGKMEIIPVKYELSSVIHDLINMVDMKAHEKGLALVVEVDEQLPTKLLGDDVRIRQIILNILSNAVKYTNEGAVTLRVNGKKQNEKYILHVEVEDTGIGIREEDKEKIFNSFQRLEEMKNRNIEGTGLGMSITTSFLRMMGSKLKLDSEYGKGSLFYFDLEQEIVDETPIGSVEHIFMQHRESAMQEGCSFEAPNANILVVDDNKMNLEVFTGLLKHTQMKITTTDNGKDALEQIVMHDYDVIFMDHMMPEMDGIETFHEMQRMWKETPSEVKTKQETPVVVLTANAIYGAKAAYLQEGFCDYLSKPIDYQKLEEIIVKCLPKDKVLFVERSMLEEGDLFDFLDTKISIEDEKFRNLERYGVNLEMGLKNMGGSVETYDEILTIYFEELAEKLGRIRKNGTMGDMKAYSVDAHSLKSTSASIGAMHLSEVAKEHEMRSRNDDSLYVRKNLARLCAECEKMLRAGKEYLN